MKAYIVMAAIFVAEMIQLRYSKSHNWPVRFIHRSFTHSATYLYISLSFSRGAIALEVVKLTTCHL